MKTLNLENEVLDVEDIGLEDFVFVIADQVAENEIFKAEVRDNVELNGPRPRTLCSIASRTTTSNLEVVEDEVIEDLEADTIENEVQGNKN